MMQKLCWTWRLASENRQFHKVTPIRTDMSGANPHSVPQNATDRQSFLRADGDAVAPAAALPEAPSERPFLLQSPRGRVINAAAVAPQLMGPGHPLHVLRAAHGFERGIIALLLQSPPQAGEPLQLRSFRETFAGLALQQGVGADLESSYSALRSAFECPVSMQPLRDPKMLPCGHMFEESWIRRALFAQGQCCYCKAPTTLNALMQPPAVVRQIAEAFLSYDTQCGRVTEPLEMPVATPMLTMHLAAACGQVDRVMALLAQDPMAHHARDVRQRTAIQPAARYGQTAVVVALLTHDGTAHNTRDIFRFAPIHAAAAHGHVDVVSALLAHDSRAHLAVINGAVKTIHLAALAGYANVVSVLLAHDETFDDARDANGCAAMHYAAEEGHIDVVRVLLAHDALAHNTQTRIGSRAIHVAARRGHVGVISALLAHDASTHQARRPDGLVALDIAAHNGHEAIVAMLRAHDSRVN